MQWYQDNIGGAYVPVIQSGESLREKFIKIEDAIKRYRNSDPPLSKRDRNKQILMKEYQQIKARENEK